MEDYLDTLASDFGPRSLKAVREKMLDATGSRGKPLSRKYINKMIERIRRAFSWGVENELIEAHVCAALREVKGLKKGRTTAPEPPRVIGVPDAIVAQTLPFCSTVVADMIKIQQLTGMRPGEVVCLTPAMVDRSGEVWIADLVDHKTAYRGSDRRIFIGPKAQLILLKYLLRASDAALFSPREAEAERRQKQHANRVTPLSCGNVPGSNVVEAPKRTPGTSYTSESYNRAIAYACEKVWPVPKGASKEEASSWKEKYWWSPNQLRHAAATKFEPSMESKPPK